jgi:hypothetical protein
MWRSCKFFVACMNCSQDATPAAGSANLPWKSQPWSYMLSSYSFSTIILCMIIQAVIIFHILSGLQVLARYRTIAHLDWSTPNVRSTSFLAASCALANLLHFSWSRTVFISTVCIDPLEMPSHLNGAACSVALRLCKDQGDPLIVWPRAY